MSKYRARHCPRCNYFIGFAVTRQVTRSGESTVTNFCLNCNHRLPVRRIIHGARKTAPSLRRSGLRLVHNTLNTPAFGTEGESQRNDMDSRISSADYARHLRAIGQDLETRHLSQFNLEFNGDAYWVWVKAGDQVENSKPLMRISKNRLQKLWRNRTSPRTIGHEESYANPASEMGRRMRYSVQELDRIEQEQYALRHRPSGSADGHSLSQLLRTVGDLVGQRSARLLGIAWQDLSIAVVVETPQGRKEIDIFRPDNLYDLWVRMYLKRNNRASPNGPR